jgi:hypothetical protein
MRRSSTFRPTKRTGHVKKDLSKDQLAGIGAVAIVYNETENLINILLSLSLQISWPLHREVTSRINGVDGKIEIAKAGLRDLGASEEMQLLVAQTLGDGGFSLLKKYRDLIIHATVLDVPVGIGLSPGKRGKSEEILLTTDALDGVFERLEICRLELLEALKITVQLRSLLKLREADDLLSSLPHLAGASGPQKLAVEQDIRAFLSQYHEHQKRRLFLPPLPEFPEAPSAAQVSAPVPDAPKTTQA